MNFEKIFLGPIVATITGLLLPLATLWGAFYFQQLINDTYEAYVFWSMIAAYVMLSSFTKAAENRFQQKLVQQSIDLETAVSTMPPESFMNVYGKVYVEAHKLYKITMDAKPTITKIDLEWTIRAVLSGIITLTMKFDKPSDEDKGTYHANIMFFCDNYKNDEKEKKKLEKCLLFGGDLLSLDKLQGVLYLEKQLSTNSNTEEPEIDSTIKSLELALPVPKSVSSKHTERTHVLPGAPLLL